MSVKTSAPHWSLWMVDQMLPELTLPMPLADPEGDWDASWSIHELDNTRRRTSIDGSLDLSLRRAAGGGRTLGVVQKIPMFWRMSVETVATIQCNEDLWLSPASWETTAVSEGAKGPIEETRSSGSGELSGRQLHFKSVDDTTRSLAEKDGWCTSWGLLAALPRLTRAGLEEGRFHLFDELVATRPNQQLKRLGTVDVPLQRGTRRLHHWRHLGQGTPPVNYFTSNEGWPMIVCSLRRALVCRSLGQAPAEGSP